MAQYLTTISVPACDTDGNRRNIDLTCHVKLSPLIMAAFTDMASIKFPIQDAYAYCWRYMASGGGNLSYHSYGSCIDVNADANPAVYWGYAPDPSSPYYNNTQVVTIWKSHGFYWGGDWSSSYYDPMHFTYTDN
jgi:hypothetical protein